MKILPGLASPNSIVGAQSLWCWHLKDDTPRVKAWLMAGRVAPVTDAEAMAWQEADDLNQE